MRRAKLQLAFAGVTTLCALLATVGFDIFARVTVSHAPFETASSEALKMFGNPFWTVILFAPFFAAGVLSAEMAEIARLRVGALFFATLLVILGWLYFSGYWGAQTALEQHKWTAASLSVGLIPFVSFFVVLVAAIVVGVYAWKNRRRET